MANEKNIHEGHRQRLLNTILEGGLGPVSEVVALEFILSYVLPRCDTNPIAHRMLDKFGSVAGVMEADWEFIAEVEGMGETSAKKLHLMLEIFNYYTDQMITTKYLFLSRTNIADFFEELLRFQNVEKTYIIGIDAKNKLKAKQKLSTGGLTSVGITTHQVAKFITGIKPTFIMLGHNHPQGKATPSKMDVEGTKVIAELAQSLNAPLVDHVIVGTDGVYSITNDMYYREFKNF